MLLPEDDEHYLNQKGFDWEVASDSSGGCLILKQFPLNPQVYDKPATNLMIRIPAQYNIAGLDMFYADPPVRLKNGAYPNAADNFETHVGRNWQRFSRHLPTPWRAGIDGIATFLALIRQELQ